MNSLSVVIPVYNAESSLEELCQQLFQELDRLGWASEIIFVNDASTDGSWACLQRLRAADKRVKIINFSRNFGQHLAIFCGLSHAQGDLVVTMDDDLQHPPDQVRVLISAITADPDTDVFIGQYDGKKHAWYRNIGTTVLDSLTSAIFQKPKDLKMTSFRILRRKVVQDMLQHKTASPRIGHVLLMVTNRIKNVPVRHQPRRYGRSAYTFRRLINDFLDNVLANSSLPLRFVSYIGVFVFLLSTVMTAYFLIKYLTVGIPVPGWTTVVITMFSCFGLLFLSIGIIGEYLIRILQEAKKLPQYVVRDFDLE